MTSGASIALVVVATALATPVSRAQPCSNQVVARYGTGTLVGMVNAGAVFDDHSGTGPALFIGGNGGGSMIVNNQSASLAKLVNGQWTRNATISGRVNCLTVLDDGSGPTLFVGGNFTIAPSPAHVHVAKWDGASWNALPRVDGSNTDVVDALAVYDDGGGDALYAGGTFSGSTLATKGVVKWDGQAWTALGAGVTTAAVTISVRTLMSYDDGTGRKLYVGGNITTAGGIPVTGLASWDGAAWAPVGPGFASGHFGSDVYSLAAFDDGDGMALYASGVIDLPSRNNGNAPVAMWRDGQWTAALGVGAGVSVNMGSPALLAFDDGSGPALYAAVGQFVEGGSQVERLQNGAWTSVGASFTTTFSAGFGASVNQFVAVPTAGGPRLAALGNMTMSGPARAASGRGLEQWRWGSLENIALGLGEPARVFSDQQAMDGRLYASGLLLTDLGWSTDSPDPIPASPYVHLTLNGTLVTLTANADGVWIKSGGVWQSFPSPGTGLVKLCVADDGSGEGLFAIMAGFWPNGSGGNDAGGRIEKWNGSSWDFVGPTIPRGGSGGVGGIRSLTSYDDGTGLHLYIGGGLWTPMGSNDTPYLAEWVDGQWVAIDGVDGTVNDLLVFDVGSGPELIIAGDFTETTGTTTRGIARWNGSRLAGVGAAGLGLSAKGNVLRVFNDGRGTRLWAGSTAGNSQLSYWNGAAWVGAAVITALSSDDIPSVTSLAEVDRPDGSRSLFVGGTFTSVNGVPSNDIAELAVCRHTCTADFNGDGDVGTDMDIEAFFACLSGTCCASCGAVDFNNDGDVGTDMDIESFFRVLAGGAC